ncbi:SDR family oxidoreductase [Streptomyces rubiginosohelvolus]|uniref:SDR family oxidoreductase n=1 Tax=Streptomyces rubiginosohelvolus TaxID=67362 RepID=UPI0037B16C69
MARIVEAGGRAFAVRALFGESGALDRLFEGFVAGLKEHGADGLDVLVNELGQRGITVNTVEPGVVLTDMIGDYPTAPEAVAALESITALGRMGLPEDVADVVGFLAGPQGRWVTGQIIDASGGTYLGPLMPG